MILITGGNGIVGARLALTFQKLKGSENRFERVRVLGLAPAPSDFDLRQAGIEVQYGDVTRPEDLESSMQGVDTVFHLAAVLVSPENPSRHHAINVEGTRTVLAAAERNAVKHFIFISSISVTYPRRNAYSQSKAEAEEWVRRSPVAWTIVRPCLVLDGLEYQAFQAAVLRWPVVLLPRRGAARKRPISSEDLSDALAKLVGDARIMGKTLALGGHKTVSLRDMALSILNLRGIQKPVWPVPEGLLRGAAAAMELLSRTLARRISWLSHQSVDGLVYDAAPEMDTE